MKRVCDDAANDGYDSVEGYPVNNADDSFKHYHGYPDMFLKAGFEKVRDLGSFSVYRNNLA